MRNTIQETIYYNLRFIFVAQAIGYDNTPRWHTDREVKQGKKHEWSDHLTAGKQAVTVDLTLFIAVKLNVSGPIVAVIILHHQVNRECSQLCVIDQSWTKLLVWKLWWMSAMNRLGCNFSRSLWFFFQIQLTWKFLFNRHGRICCPIRPIFGVPRCSQLLWWVKCYHNW